MRLVPRWSSIATIASASALSLGALSTAAFAATAYKNEIEDPTETSSQSGESSPMSGDVPAVDEISQQSGVVPQSHVVDPKQKIAPADIVELNLLNINDFHGRIDGELSDDNTSLIKSSTVDFAWTIEQLRAEYGAPNTAFLSAGDNVGASLFASSIDKDVPTIKLLNILGLQASAIGNHEFDGGWEDVRRIQNLMDAPILGANVYEAGSDVPALPEYAVLDVAGLRVGVIGAVTQETPSLVNPAMIAGLEFRDPVDAVNRVAQQLEADDRADIIVAEYHDGAAEGSSESNPEAQVAASETFARIVNDTSSNVDVIFTGHTHKEYAWAVPVPGSTDAMRPIVQTGSYGEYIGQVVLSVNAQTHEVEAFDARNVSVAAMVGETPMATLRENSVVEQAYQVILAALVKADDEGNRPTGLLGAPITRGYPEGVYEGGYWLPFEESGDSRAEASALGTLVANSLRDSLNGLESAPDLGVVNPGGLRTDLVPNDDGVITVAQARAVLPFNNELSIASLTGEQLITMLEQQWQRNADGSLPSRPYLQLGLSDNVSYTYSEIVDPGYDDGRTVGVINSLTINGHPVDPEQTYRVGTFAFLAAGGDNFRVFNEASSVLNTGFLDWESWLAYLASTSKTSPIEPDFARQGVETEGLTDTVWTAGETRTVTFSRMNIFSYGAPENTEAVLNLGDTEIATAPVVEGSVSFEFKVPDDLEGEVELWAEVNPSGTRVSVPVNVVTPATEPAITVTAAKAENKEKGKNLAATGASVAMMLVLAGGVGAGGYLLVRRSHTIS